MRCIDYIGVDGMFLMTFQRNTKQNGGLITCKAGVLVMGVVTQPGLEPSGQKMKRLPGKLYYPVLENLVIGLPPGGILSENPSAGLLMTDFQGLNYHQLLVRKRGKPCQI
jgi:hypothetical protein